MIAKVDLLPESYRRSRSHERRFRAGLTVGAILLAGELATGLVLHARAGETRHLFAELERDRHATDALKQELVGPLQEMARVTQQVTLATQLRTTHRWSRLLGMLAEAAPERVVLTAVSTDPPRWTPTFRRTPRRGSEDKTSPRTGLKPLIEGVTIRGNAIDHGDLSAFIAAIRASGAFASVDLKNARRDQFFGSDAVAFELECHW